MKGARTREAPGWDRLGRRKPKPRSARGRGAWLRDALRALVLLRRGRWGPSDLAAELGVTRRSVNRLLAQLAAVGVPVERHAEGREVFYRVPTDGLRRLLEL